VRPQRVPVADLAVSRGPAPHAVRGEQLGDGGGFAEVEPVDEVQDQALAGAFGEEPGEGVHGDVGISRVP
jgi:RNA-splicing ligase RtcB